MSLDTVVEDIREEARERAEEIREEGRERAEEIREEAEADAADIVAEAEQEVERTVEREREQTLSSAKLEAKQERLEARREVLQQVRADVEAALADVEGDRRRELTAALLEDAASEYPDAETVEVSGRADDADLLAELVADYDGWTHAGEYDCLGGVVVEAEGSRIRVNNTFDSVLEDVWEDNLRDVSTRLFDEQ